MSKSYIVLVLLQAKSGKQQQLKEQLLALVEPSRHDKGCIEYHLHEDPTDPTKFMFYEIWASQADHAQHLETPHLKAWIAVQDELLAKPADVMFWNRVE